MNINNKDSQNLWDCPQCKRPAVKYSGDCNYCGFVFRQNKETENFVTPSEQYEIENQSKSIKSTINLQNNFKDNSFEKTENLGFEFFLKPIAKKNESEREIIKINANTNEIILGNGIPGMEYESISNKQAVMVFSSGSWKIKSMNEQNPTYILASDFKEIKEGDILLIGNHPYIFKLNH